MGKITPPFPAPVKNWYNDTYPAIDPTRPEVSAAGKSVIIIGGGTGIGRATVEAFAQAKASSIAITGRRLAPLEETKKIVESKYKVPVHVFSADVTDAKVMKKVAEEVGGWDILVHNAGYYADKHTITDTDLEEWWKGWEINVKGPVTVWKSFRPTAKKNAVFIVTATAAVTLPLQYSQTSSSYVGSKQGLIKTFEILAVEEKDVSVRILHPGVVETEMAEKAGGTRDLPVDKAELPAHFTVWFASPEAAFLQGRLVSCNWDIEELKAAKDKIAGTGIFQVAQNGFGGPLLASL